MKTNPPRMCLRIHSLRLPIISGSIFLMILFSALYSQGQTCNDLSTISLDADCAVEITPDMVLEGTPVDTSYIVNLTTMSGLPIGKILTAAQLGDTVRATITDTLTGNSCWGLLYVEDKLAPSLVCTNITLPCAVTQYSPAYLSNVLALTAAYPQVIENCNAYTLSYIDTWMDLDCNDPQDRSAYLQRVWTATDASGNQSGCTQFLHFQRVHAGQILFPDDVTVSCSNPLTTPTQAGEPYVTAFGKNFPLFSGDLSCELDIVYQDQVLSLCSGSYKILRTWTVLDDCLLTNPLPPLFNPVLHIQVITVNDNTGPVFSCPKDTVVSTDPFKCTRHFDLPDVILADDCSWVTGFQANWVNAGLPFQLAGVLSDFPGNNYWNSDTLGVLSFAQNLPAGVTTIKYTATDQCGNAASCTFRVTVSDGVVPWAVCDEFTQVALGITGEALIHASTFDDGSGDNCSPVQFKVRRVDANACQSADLFYDKVKFCCADVGDTISIILRVYDLPADSGAVSQSYMEAHSSDCEVRVFVEDKLKPVCVPPPHLIVGCENFDPSLQSYGVANYADNCCLDTFFELKPNYSLFDTLCNRGTLVRTFRAFDCHGWSSQCTQRIIVNYTNNYSVKFPDDVFVNDCDTTGVYSPGPEIFGADCETIAISYHDNVSTGGILSCYWIERRWMVVDWCSYNPNLPLIEVPNPNPAPDPLDVQNIPGPVVAPIGHNPEPTKMRISPNDLYPTDYSTFWKAEANGYVYRQIISVRDDQPPKIRGCPVTLPVQFCDHTTNDPNFWNAPYWNNPHVPNSNDLCEGITELAVTASDGCSKGAVNIRYLLYLDLDGDGEQETVINSINPPPTGMVLYNNAMTPNFLGGTLRAFDQRPVPPEEKYRFTLLTGGYVNVTGYVRWVSAKDPGKYVIPQLPHGDHRIQWIIDDGCGNETRCEYPIRVRDCLVPELVCLNGLSVDIPMDKSITFYANDFLVYTSDNCTPGSQLAIGLRKSGTGTGFPFNPDNTPQQSVTFTCDDLGTQFVELWVMDDAGNFNVCETYVIVQDNFGICSSTMGTIAGQLQTKYGHGLEDGSLILAGSHPAVPSFDLFGFTNIEGKYLFSNALPYGANLTISPQKDNDPLNGVSTFDLVLINKHILGNTPLGDPYLMIAADVNGSRSVTTFDIVELRKLILGIYTDFPSNTSWRFVDKNYTFPNTANPFQEIFPETKQIANIQSSKLQENFIAIKTGDVNGNAVTSSLHQPQDRSQGTALFEVSNSGDDWVKAGQTVRLRVEAAEDLMGCQFTMNFPQLEFLKLEPGEGLTAEHFAVFQQENALSMSWNGPGRPGFTLTFRARTSGLVSQMLQVSSRITRAEAYREEGPDGGAALLDIALRFAGGVVAGQSFELYATQPNPWHNQTRLPFYLPQAELVTLIVTDQNGTVLLQEKRHFEKGHQALLLTAAQLPVTGVLFYRLEAGKDWGVGKMVRF